MNRFCTLPYEGEILYSVVARSGVYLGLKNALLTRTLLGRRILASIEPTRYLDELEKKLQDSMLEIKHTLRPLELPFHAGRKPLRNRWLRYCPHCVKEQRIMYGEAFWQTACQIKEVNICPKHGTALLRSAIHAGTGGIRFGFVDLNRYLEMNAAADVSETPAKHEELLAAEANAVLQCAERLQPTEAQWKRFYAKLMPKLQDEAGGEFYWPELYAAVEGRWTRDWLKQQKLLTITRSNCCWYQNERWLYHLTLIKAVAPEMTLLDAIRQAAKN